jgi:ribosomal protein S8
VKIMLNFLYVLLYFIVEILSENTARFYRIIKTAIVKIYYSVEFVILYLLKNEGFITTIIQIKYNSTEYHVKIEIIYDNTLP